jgi:outer membrane biogenesis lipoprotein LolB
MKGSARKGVSWKKHCITLREITHYEMQTMCALWFLQDDNRRAIRLLWKDTVSNL